MPDCQEDADNRTPRRTGSDALHAALPFPAARVHVLQLVWIGISANRVARPMIVAPAFAVPIVGASGFGTPPVAARTP